MHTKLVGLIKDLKTLHDFFTLLLLQLQKKSIGCYLNAFDCVMLRSPMMGITL